MSHPPSSSPPLRRRGGSDRPPSEDINDKRTDSRPASLSSLRGMGDDRQYRLEYTRDSTHDRPQTRPVGDINVNNARFVTLHALGSTPLAKLNPFLVKRVIDYNVGGSVDAVRKLASGDLLVNVNTPSQVRDLLRLKKFHDLDVEASIPVSMNSCKGVASCRDFIGMEERDIIHEMKDQDVIDARFITRFVDGERRKTATIVFTFGTAKLPERLFVGYEIVNVRPYIPNPLRCFKCQSYGHHGKTCRSLRPVCGRCAGEGHDAESCTSQNEKCHNCAGAHSTSSRDCPTWKVEKEVCAVKALEGISYFDARKKVKEALCPPQPDVSYASKARSRPEMCNAGTQTDLPPPADATPSTSKVPTVTSVSTTTTSTTKPSYSSTINSSTPPLSQKGDKSTGLNLTTLKKPTSHVLPKTVPPRSNSTSSCASRDSGPLIIDEDMEVSGRKSRTRPSGSGSPGGGSYKKKKHAGHHPPS